ncbi:MAG: glycosyltransferase [Verrucomicrobiota bacterium]
MERVLLIFWAFWILMVLVAAVRVFAFLIARRVQDKRWGDGSRNQRPAVVIVPVKGFDLQASPRFFDVLFSQNYSNYRVLVAFESWQDPVAVWLRDELELDESNPIWQHPDPASHLQNITLVSAGTSDREGQKVHNQRAAFEHLTPEDEVVAFVDADIVFEENWLARLLAPINQKTHPLTTTYRWLIPKRPTLPNQVASVINGSITTQGGWESTTVLWGGSMAIARSVFDKLDVPTLLEGSLNDDLRLSKAARAAGNRIAFIRSLIVPTIIDFSWSSFFEFAKRQYTQVKFFSPILYTGTNIVLGLYVVGLLSIVAALVYGYFFAWIPVAVSYVIDQFRSLARQQVYLSLFPENGIRRKLFSASWLEHMLTPFWMLLHWLLLISTWTQSKITWAGITYRILAKDKTRILDRPVVAEKLPVGVPGLAMIAALNDRKRGSYTQPIRPAATEPIAVPAVTTTVTEPAATTVAVTPGEPAPEPTIEAAKAASEPVPHPGVSPSIPLLTDRAPSRKKKTKASKGARAPLSPFRQGLAKGRHAAKFTSPVSYATCPELASSKAPEKKERMVLEQALESPQPVIESVSRRPSVSPTSSLPLRGVSAAASRKTLPRTRRISVVSAGAARTSRVNSVGTRFAPGRSRRPVSRGAAGRP